MSRPKARRYICGQCHRTLTASSMHTDRLCTSCYKKAYGSRKR